MSIIHTILKSYYLKKKLYKIYLESDLIFYGINFNQMNTNFIMNEEELYNDTIEGIPAFLIFQNPVDKKYQYFTDFKAEKLDKKQTYALLYYDYKGTYSTKTVTMVISLRLKKIVIKKS